MNNDVNREFRLKSRPVGRIKDSDFEYVETPIPRPQDSEGLCRDSAIRPSMAAWPTPIRTPASRTGSLQTRLGL